MNTRDLLLENNLGFIRKTANEIYFGMNLGESELSIDKDDLEQDGCIGLLDVIPLFDGSKSIKFLTHAAPSIRNSMTDTTDGLAFPKICLDEVISGEERMLRIEAITNSITKSPEKIYIEQETLRELYETLDGISNREKAYLLYSYGFTDDVEHKNNSFNIHES